MIRRNVREDMDRVYELICQLEEEKLSYTEFMSIYEEQRKDDRYCCLVYERECHISAVLNMRFERQLHHAGKIAEILEFIVRQEERGKGIGKELFECACQIASENGCMQIELATNQRRTGAHRFYSREGMTNSHYTFTKKLD